MPAVPFLQPRPIREARMLAKHARRLLHRRRDLLPEATVAETHAEIDRLDAAAKAGDVKAATEQAATLDPRLAKMFPARSDSSWRENCEVFLVSLILVVAVRAYFFQPFKIPTGSMQPTLNGITAHPLPADVPFPGFAQRVLEGLWLGRSYVDVRAEADDLIVGFQESEEQSLVFRRLYTQTVTRLACASGRSYKVPAPVNALLSPEGFNLGRGRMPRSGEPLAIRAGEPLARGYVASGDQVFVDKLTYHFRRPRRADVFVFRTAGIPGITMTDPNVLSQFYIKRLAGLPGDTLRIAAPELFINGERPRDPRFERVMSGTFQQPNHDYRGYANLNALGSPKDTVHVPSDGYFALGDNSYASFDSRGWGPVPERNVVGRGLFVYWPFTRHWGIIH